MEATDFKITNHFGLYLNFADNESGQGIEPGCERCDNGPEKKDDVRYYAIAWTVQDAPTKWLCSTCVVTLLTKLAKE